MVKRNRRRPLLKITAGGTGLTNHAGARLLADLADAVGLTDALSSAVTSTKQRRRGHDRGQVLVDLAVMVADGGETISDLATLRNQPRLFGESRRIRRCGERWRRSTTTRWSESKRRGRRRGFERGRPARIPGSM